MPLPLLAYGAIAAAPSIGRFIGGLFGNKRANQLARETIRPQYAIPDEFKQNVAMAEQMSRVGLPEQQYQNAIGNINRNQAGALTTLSRSANPSAGLTSLVRQGNQATMNLDAADAQARNSNQRLAMQQRGIMGQQELAKQQWDKFDKYTQNAQAIAGMKGAAQQNMFGGLNDIAQLGLIGATGGFNGSPKAPPVQTAAPTGFNVPQNPYYQMGRQVPYNNGQNSPYNYGAQWGQY